MRKYGWKKDKGLIPSWASKNQNGEVVVGTMAGLDGYEYGNSNSDANGNGNDYGNDNRDAGGYNNNTTDDDGNK